MRRRGGSSYCRCSRKERPWTSKPIHFSTNSRRTLFFPILFLSTPSAPGEKYVHTQFVHTYTYTYNSGKGTRNKISIQQLSTENIHTVFLNLLFCSLSHNNNKVVVLLTPPPSARLSETRRIRMGRPLPEEK